MSPVPPVRNSNNLWRDKALTSTNDRNGFGPVISNGGGGAIDMNLEFNLWCDTWVRENKEINFYKYWTYVIRNQQIRVSHDTVYYRSTDVDPVRNTGFIYIGTWFSVEIYSRLPARGLLGIFNIICKNNMDVL